MIGQQTVTVFLPYPPEELSPNFHTSHWTRAKAAREYRQLAKVEGLNARRRVVAEENFPLKTPVVMNIVFYLDNRQRRDLDNLLSRVKSGIDGIVDSGLIRDDNAWDLQLYIKVERAPEKAVRFTLTGAP